MLRLLINLQEFNNKRETSCALSNIHKSKLASTNLRCFKISKTNICLVFSSKLGTPLMKIGFLKEKQLKDTNVFWGALTIYTFLQPHRQGICKNKSQLRLRILFLVHIIIFKRIFCVQCFKNCIWKHNRLFLLLIVFPILATLDCLLPSSHVFCNYSTLFYIHIFFQLYCLLI